MSKEIEVFEGVEPVIVTAECDECREPLEIDFNHSNGTIYIKPCDHCIAMAEEEVRDGYRR